MECAHGWVGLLASHHILTQSAASRLLVPTAREAVRGINADYDVRGLCKEFPDRLATCISKGGDRLRK